MSTRREIIAAVERLQALLRAYPRNGRDTELLWRLGVYVFEERREAEEMRVARALDPEAFAAVGSTKHIAMSARRVKALDHARAAIKG
ncbi:hypothetical protein ABID65_007558 [Bradyrhizobium sp. S3.9.2]|uniref:hypothetical protein n=1 Tax=Bradyrhizobium sp. S3.9.2 TaxID=3156432 RepID=UPI003392226C